MTPQPQPPQSRAKDTPVEWYTPPEIFAAIGLRFDLDPCAPRRPAADWIPANVRISLPDDGLAADWNHGGGRYCHGGVGQPRGRACHCSESPNRIWLNPPYGDQCGKWVGKLADHGRGIALVFVRTDADWWQACAAKATSVTFLKQRVSFIPGHRTDRGLKNTNSGAASCLLAYGGGESQACADSGLGLTFDCRELLSPPPLQGAFL